MKLKMIAQTNLLTALSMWSLNVLADSLTVACPAVDLVSHASKQMDDAIPNNRTYIVTTSQPAFTADNRAWVVRTEVPARNEHDAIKLAQITVQESTALMTPNAIKIFNRYGCTYFSARAFVYAFTPLP